MTKYSRARRTDVTARQTNKIQYLQRMVNDSETIVAQATAKYDSFVTKADIFSTLYNEAVTDRQTAEGYWKMFQQVKSDLNGLDQTADEANMIAVDAFYDVRQLIVAWKDVTAQTLNAAEAIVLSANYIQKRKASNPLISNDLVTDATDAVKAAEKTVQAVINAFSNALSTLSSSAQANNSTELTSVYIGVAVAALLDNASLDDLLPLIPAGTGDAEALAGQGQEIRQRAKAHQPLESSLRQTLQAANKKVKLTLKASEAANREMNKAKEELAQAEAALATWEAALLAAETAVAG